MAKNYTVVFGVGDTRGYTGLSPTFLIFWNLATGTTNTPPSIAETVAGKTGLYTFAYGTTQPINFLIDAATTSPGPSGRFVSGQIDPADRIDEVGTSLIALGTTHFGQGVTIISLGVTGVAIGTTNVAIGTSNIALGTTAVAGINALGSTLGGIGVTLIALGTSSVALGNFIGSTASSYGTTAIDPTTVFGYLKRAQEIAEGNQTYTKSTGVLDLFTRGATLLREKTIADTASTTTKS